MTDKQKQALEAILAALPGDCRDSYAQIAQCAIDLGYMPSLKGVRKDYADFTNAKLKRTILKINANPDFRWIAMKFYALPAYKGVFARAIADRLATWDRLGYAARCFGCGKCDGTHGYSVTLPDGAPGFLCGHGVLPLAAFTAGDVEAVRDALRVQHAFFVKAAN